MRLLALALLLASCGWLRDLRSGAKQMERTGKEIQKTAAASRSLIEKWGPPIGAGLAAVLGGLVIKRKLVRRKK